MARDDAAMQHGTFQHFVRLLLLMRPYWRRAFQGTALGLFIGLVGMVAPYSAKLLVDRAYPARDMQLVELLVAGVLLVGVATSAMAALRAYFMAHLSAELGQATHLLFFNHLQHLPMRFFEEHRVGEVQSRFADVRSSLATVMGAVQTVFVSGIYLLLVPPILFLLEWRLALFTVAVVPVMVGVTTASATFLRRLARERVEAFAELSAAQAETLALIRGIKALGMEREVYRQSSELGARAVRVQLKMAAYRQLFGFAGGLVRAVGAAAFTWYAWRLILQSEMTLGDYLAFMAYAGYLYRPLSQLLGLAAEFQQASVAIGRMFEYLDLAVEQDPRLAYRAPVEIRHRLHGGVRLERVTFGYAASGPVLHDLTLDLERGSVTAIVGASGSGKSTLLRLLHRLEEPDRGGLWFDGVAAKAIPLGELRRQIAVVGQEHAVVRGTFWDNLTLGLDGVARDEVDEVVRVCRLDALLDQLPGGYASPVAEWGASLSGGQRQRIAIARALLRHAPILLLDEATSNLDLQTEAELLRALLQRVRGRTLVFATHRLPAAALADRICMLESGRIVGEGTHAELLRSSPPYASMHESAAQDRPAPRLANAAIASVP